MPITPSSGWKQRHNCQDTVQVLEPLGRPFYSHTTRGHTSISLCFQLLAIQRMVPGHQHHVRACYKCRISGPFCSPLGSSGHGILQARVLDWVAIPFFSISSLPRGQTQMSCISGRFFTVWATREVFLYFYYYIFSPYWSWISRLLNSLKMKGLFYQCIFSCPALCSYFLRKYFQNC